MRQREAVDKAGGESCAKSENRDKWGGTEPGLSFQIGFFRGRTGEAKMPKLLINKAVEWFQQGDK
jgi:hypothetical protein